MRKLNRWRREADAVVEGVAAAEAEAVRSAVAAEAGAVRTAARVEWEVEDAEADTAGRRCREEATVAEEEPVPRRGPAAAAATVPAEWPRTGT